MILRKSFIFVLTLFLVATGAAALHAQTTSTPGASKGARAGDGQPKLLGTFEQWTASELREAGGKACYMVSRPIKSEGRYAKRGDVFITVTHRPAKKQRNEVSVKAGFPFKEGSSPSLQIGDKKFELFIRPDYDPEGAWTKDTATDKALVEAMQRGATLLLRGTSNRSTETTDTFSLKGFTKAYQEINKACAGK